MKRWKSNKGNIDMAEINDGKSQLSNSQSPSVGERLRLAREEKKITIAEVVAQLRLTKDNIVYLESDQWDKLHGRPYARGYFSSYVNFLGLPHNEMLALFNLEYTAEEPSIDGFRRSENNNQDSSATGWFKVVLLLIILSSATWFSYQYWLEKQNQPQQSKFSTDSPSASFDNELTFSDSVVEPLPTVERPQINTVEIIEEVITIQAVEEVEEPTELAVDEIVDEAVFTEEIESVQLEQQESVNNEDNIAIIDEQDMIAEAKMLVMQFSEDCWVEVSDHNNRKLLHNIVQAGETVELTGVWPLQVLLGNAAAVEVHYNNTEFDIASYTQANIARFSVGEATE